jgi:DNA-binding transcriptional ArsR family regulator
MSELDPLVHEPVRLRLLMVLSGVASADFDFLRTALSLTDGNVSWHMGKLEKAGYVGVTKSFHGKTPHTEYALTCDGRQALETYWRALDTIRGTGASGPGESGG